ncbi:hypothetical protein WDW89_13710, partial [Deltaproteobacteria bacterium TL4]
IQLIPGGKISTFGNYVISKGSSDRKRMTRKMGMRPPKLKLNRKKRWKKENSNSPNTSPAST